MGVVDNQVVEYPDAVALVRSPLRIVDQDLAVAAGSDDDDDVAISERTPQRSVSSQGGLDVDKRPPCIGIRRSDRHKVVVGRECSELGEIQPPQRVLPLRYAAVYECRVLPP